MGASFWRWFLAAMILLLFVWRELPAKQALIREYWRLILLLGLIAFAFDTVAGILFGKGLAWVTGGKVNPLVGAAGVSAVPMAARVVHKVGAEANKKNYLLMFAMGPNLAGVIGTVIAAGIFLTMLQ